MSKPSTEAFAGFKWTEVGQLCFWLLSGLAFTVYGAYLVVSVVAGLLRGGPDGGDALIGTSSLLFAYYAMRFFRVNLVFVRVRRHIARNPHWLVETHPSSRTLIEQPEFSQLLQDSQRVCSLYSVSKSGMGDFLAALLDLVARYDACASFWRQRAESLGRAARETQNGDSRRLVGLHRMQGTRR